MQIIQVSPRFSDQPVGGRRRGRPRRPGIARRRGAAGDDHDPAGLRPSICIAPQYIAEELLRAEGFTDVRYVPRSTGDAVARGEIDFDVSTPRAWIVSHLDAGEPITALAGVHSGCYELFAHEPIRTISDLKGKRVGIRRLRSGGHLYLAIMAAHVGLDPRKDIDWVTRRSERQPDGAVRRTGRSMPFSGFRPSRRSCAPARSAA